MDAQKKNGRTAGAADLWYKDAIIYQLHVKSFFDSNDDGVGDFPGLISKLDYMMGGRGSWITSVARSICSPQQQPPTSQRPTC